MNIVVLAGGLSAERDVSICSGEMVCNALRRKGHHAVLVDLFFGYTGDETDWDTVFAQCLTDEQSIDRIGQTVPDIEAMAATRQDHSRIGDNVISICKAADIVFMALHGEDGENGKVQAVFDLHGIAYTGTGYLGSAVAMNKSLSKQIFIQHGIRTPRYIITSPEHPFPNMAAIGYPCVVKPCSGGSSIGVSIVHNANELSAAIESAKKYESNIIIEQYVHGREFSIGVIDGEALPIIEIIPTEGFYDYVNKYQGNTLEVCPAELVANIAKAMQDAAVEVYHALELNVYARIDFLLDKEQQFHCLEANTLPGMTPASLLPQEAAAVGIPFDDLCELLINKSLTARQMQ